MALTNAANAPVEPIWVTLLTKALEGKNVKELLSNVGAGGGAPAASAPVAGGGAGAGAAVEEKKAEKDEESDGDMVRYCAFGLTCWIVNDIYRTSDCSIDTLFLHMCHTYDFGKLLH